MYCEATLNFATEDGISSVQQQIHDGRHAADLSLSASGFELIRHESSVTDWGSEQNINEVHYAEIRALAKEMTGCDWVLFYPAVIRTPEAASRSEDFNPIQVVHCDYTEDYFDMIRDASHPYHKIAMGYAKEEGITSADVEAVSRVLTIQFWRNTGEPKVDFPLCLGDCRDFPRDQLTPFLVEEYGGMRTEFHSFLVSPPKEGVSPWYTFPEMSPDEVIVFRSFDSERVKSGAPFWTPHSAFSDPTAGDHPPARQSVEMRAICLFK